MKCDELGLMIIIINLSNKIMSTRRNLLTLVLTFLSWNFHVTILFSGSRFLLLFLFKEIVSLPPLYHLAKIEKFQCT